MRDLSLKLFFAEGRGSAFFSKTKDINSSFNLHGDIKNKLECVLRLEERRRKGFKHPKCRSKKILPLIFMGKYINKLKCITIGRGEEEGFKHPKSWGKNSSFKLHGVNSRLSLYIETILKVP